MSENTPENVRLDAASEPSDADAIDPLRTKFVDLLLEGTTMDEAGVALQRNPRTLRRWKNEPAVRAALRERLAESTFSSRVVLTSGSVWSATALVRIACGEEPADGSRVAACKAILDGALRLTKFDELTDRISRLEEALLNATARTE
jgi:hypothetical protein